MIIYVDPNHWPFKFFSSTGILPLTFAFSLKLNSIAVANSNIRLTLGYIGQLLLLP
jgi:hypothetical protein